MVDYFSAGCCGTYAMEKSIARLFRPMAEPRAMKKSIRLFVASYSIRLGEIEAAIGLVFLSRKSNLLELSRKCRLLGLRASDKGSSEMLFGLARAYDNMLEELERQNKSNAIYRRIWRSRLIARGSFNAEPA
jgi:hypothetical protein